jgi:hypothetical protein
MTHDLHVAGPPHRDTHVLHVAGSLRHVRFPSCTDTTTRMASQTKHPWFSFSNPQISPRWEHILSVTPRHAMPHHAALHLTSPFCKALRMLPSWETVTTSCAVKSHTQACDGQAGVTCARAWRTTQEALMCILPERRGYLDACHTLTHHTTPQSRRPSTFPWGQKENRRNKLSSESKQRCATQSGRRIHVSLTNCTSTPPHPPPTHTHSLATKRRGGWKQLCGNCGAVVAMLSRGGSASASAVPHLKAVPVLSLQTSSHIHSLWGGGGGLAHMTAVVHRYAGSDPVGQIAELVTAVLNTNVHTYAVAPAFAMMEQEVIKSMAAQVGMDRATADGILCPGGTFANVTALMVARNEAFPHVRMSGWSPEDRPVCFTSAQVCIPTCIFFCICTDEDVSHRCMAAVAQV